MSGLHRQMNEKDNDVLRLKKDLLEAQRVNRSLKGDAESLQQLVSSHTSTVHAFHCDNQANADGYPFLLVSVESQDLRAKYLNTCYQQKPSLVKLDELMNLTSTVRYDIGNENECEVVFWALF